jgi:hypothetical protein
LITLGQIDTRRQLRNRNKRNIAESCNNFLRLLLNDEVLAVYLKGLSTTYEPEMLSITDTLKCVASECPHLEKLVYEEYKSSSEQMRFSDLVQILSCTLVFKQLQVIDMHRLNCTNLSLGLIADNLPHLR